MRKWFSLLLLIHISTASTANNLEWFEIEVLIFDRLNNETIPMSTQDAVSRSLPSNTRDWITPTLRPDLSHYRAAISSCNKPWEIQDLPTVSNYSSGLHLLDNLNTRDQDIMDVVSGYDSQALAPLPMTLPDLFADYSLCRQQAITDSDSNVASFRAPMTATPQQYTVLSDKHVDVTYPLPIENNALNDVFLKLKRSYGYRPLFHSSWRQRVAVGREKATPYRIYAGQHLMGENTAHFADQSALSNIEDNTTIENFEDVEPVEFIEHLRQTFRQPMPNIEVLRNDTTATTDNNSNEWQPEWQIDGWFKVYLQYVDRTPYLHIESELDYAEENTVVVVDNGQQALSQIQQPQFTLYPFKQLRRVISKQTHYFDHPLFGMITQIRRFTPPVVEDDSQQKLME